MARPLRMRLKARAVSEPNRKADREIGGTVAIEIATKENGAITMVAKPQTSQPIAATLGGAPNLSLREHAMLRKEGEYWTVGYAGAQFRLQGQQGASVHRRPTERSRYGFHALDLARGDATLYRFGRTSTAAFSFHGELDVAGIHVASLGDAGNMLDGQAKVAYRRRLAELRDELAEAKQLGRIERAERAERGN